MLFKRLLQNLQHGPIARTLCGLLAQGGPAYSIDRKYGFRFALEAKPNEPRGDIYMVTTGAYLLFIPGDEI